MHRVWRALVISNSRVKQLSIMKYEVDMRQARVVPVKQGMAALILPLKEE